ncbi:hypothetical protein ACFQI7_11735 [Paenibacillus allorhizosphaerae]|uniref:Uncharacterized protein n=1 Tax=Paenibacillus allorhizosphaerae TaxID=2849866 RepID=A0ABM8VHE3_9BACL|nr:hypothetical protein [Paenibacillus allorhizosphaerae]CAG7641421.1 hypothetical protein PAECIP111802_02739 [Paenibacillus allorhizosphaerae]
MDRNRHRQADDGYEELFIAFGRKVEKWLFAAIAILLFALVISQLMLQNPRLRYLIVKVEQLEGNRYDSSLAKTQVK